MEYSVKNMKPFVLMVAVNFALAMVNVLIKKVLDEGYNRMIIVTYRLVLSTAFLIPIAYIKERKSRYKLTGPVLCQLFCSAIVGSSLTQYFFLLGLEYTSASFSCAFVNLVPVMTFMFALLFRQEKVNLESIAGKAKGFGTLVCIGGTLVLALYKGMPLFDRHSQAETHMANHGNSSNLSNKMERSVIGSVYLILSCIMWSLWFLMQARIGKRYPCQYSSTAILSFFGAIQAALLSLISERNISMWVLKGNYVILTVVYSGIIGSGLCYVGMSWCVDQKGPVFTSAFIPLVLIFASIFGFSFLHEQIYFGSILGSIFVIAGLYILLWGKSNDAVGVSSSKQINVVAEEDDDDDDNADRIPVSVVAPVTVSSTCGK